MFHRRQVKASRGLKRSTIADRSMGRALRRRGEDDGRRRPCATWSNGAARLSAGPPQLPPVGRSVRRDPLSKSAVWVERTNFYGAAISGTTQRIPIAAAAAASIARLGHNFPQFSPRAAVLEKEVRAARAAGATQVHRSRRGRQTGKRRKLDKAVPDLAFWASSTRWGHRLMDW